MTDDFTLPPLAPDLSLVPLETLIEELSRRAEYTVIIQKVNGETRPQYQFFGNFYGALGIVTQTQYTMLQTGMAPEDERDEA